MAASPVQPQDFLTADLRDFRASELDLLLEEQCAFWNQRFQWDFSASADVIRRFLDMRNLFGFALLRDGKPVGYSYFVNEDRKALVGDLFITAAHRSEAAERVLLHDTIKSAVVFPNVRRVEGQLLGLSFNPCDEVIYGRNLAVFERNFMMLEDPRGFPTAGFMRLRPPPRSVSTAWQTCSCCSTVMWEYSGSARPSVLALRVWVIRSLTRQTKRRNIGCWWTGGKKYRLVWIPCCFRARYT